MQNNAITVLVVDDEALIRLAMAAELQDAGITVTEAYNASEALNILEGDTDIDVLITDIRMPGRLDGLDLARHAADRWPDMGLILTSGEGRVSMDELPDGSRYFAKPYESRQLVAAIRGMVHGYAI